MKPETLGIFSFFISLTAFQLLGLLIFIAASSSSSGSISASWIVTVVVIFSIVGALLTGLKVYALERR
jgi:hypothetical protein